MTALRIAHCFRAALVIAATGGILAVWAVAAPPPALVPAQFDFSPGSPWNVQADGSLGSDGSGWFERVAYLQLNNSSVSLRQRMMTADRSQYVLSGGAQNVQITRHVRFERQQGTVRYIEQIQNPGPADVTLQVRLMTMLRRPLGWMMTDGGTAMGNPASGGNPFGGNLTATSLGDKDSGLVITAAGSQQLALVFFLASPRSAIRPRVEIQSNQLSFQYTLSVPPRKTVSILHGVCQQPAPAAPNKQAVAAMFKPFEARDFFRDVPKEIAQTVVNGQPGSAGELDEVEGVALMQPLDSLAGSWKVERGEKDILIQEEDAQLSGQLRGDPLTITTRYGPATVPWDEVAAVTGGAGIGRTMRVYLRNGEILSGPISWKSLTLETGSGLVVEVLPGPLNVLLARRDPQRERAPSGAVMLVETRWGDRLAVQEGTAVQLAGTTAWGPIEISLADVRLLMPMREPQPLYRLVLNDRSQLSVILHSRSITVPTFRFPSVELPMCAITRLVNLATGLAAEGEAVSDEELKQTRVPYGRLAGGDVLVGTLDLPQLELEIDAGVTKVDLKVVRLIEREQDDPRGLTFTVELADDSRLTGRLRQATLPLRTARRVWKIPARQIEAIVQPVERAEEDVSGR